MSPLTYHGPGDRLDAFTNDPTNSVSGHAADAATHAAAITAAVKGPEIIAPPGTLFAASGLAAWYTINSATFHRFTVPVSKAYRYVNLYVGGLSGNVQCGVVSIRRSGTQVFGTRVMDSGVLAMSGLVTNALNRLDCGAVTLAPGEYGLFLWCDNTTATFLHGLATGITASRLTWAQTAAGGIAAPEQEYSTTTRWVTGLTLESAS